MAASNQSSDVNDHRDNSGDTSRPPLPLPDNGDNVCPVPLWEIEFCRKAYNIPWETFCENKRFIRLYRNVMDWDDSGGLENFKEAKERFRAKHFGEPFEDPVLDQDMYIDETDHHCNVDPKLFAELNNIARLAHLDLAVDLGWGRGMANQTPTGWRKSFSNLMKPTGGWGETSNPTCNVASGSQGNQPTEAVGGAQPSYCRPTNSNSNLHGGASSGNWQQQGVVDPGQTSSGTGRMVIGGGTMWISGASTGGAVRLNGGAGGARNFSGAIGSGGGNATGRNFLNAASGSGSGSGGGNGTVRNLSAASGSGSGGGGGNGKDGTGRSGCRGGIMNWNCFGRGSGSGRNRNGGGGGKQKDEAEGQHQQRNSGGMQRNQNEGQHQMRSGGRQRWRQGRMKMEWRPVRRNRAP